LIVRTVPVAVLLMLALFWLSRAAHAEDAAAAPADAARAAALARAAGQPSDWTARYDLGVAESNAQRPAFAFAETAAAFAQAPAQPVVRAALRELAGSVPYANARMLSLMTGASPVAWLAAWQWQAVLLMGALLMATALGAISLAHAPRAAVAMAVLGVACAGSAANALTQYGALADPRAALVAEPTVLRGLPTDAQPSDGVAPLAVGALVRSEKTFLGWTFVRLADDSSGWVRSGELVPMYAAPSA